MDNKKTLFAKGGNGQISFDGQQVVISRRGFSARLSVGKGDKVIPITSITATRFRQATWALKGFVQFSVLGDLTARGNIGDLDEDENTIIFYSPISSMRVKPVVDAINEAIAARAAETSMSQATITQNPSSPQNSSAEIPIQTSRGASGYRLSVSLTRGADPVNVSVGILEVLLEESCRESPSILSLEYDEIESTLKSGRALYLGEFQLAQYRIAKQTIEAVGGLVTADSI